MVTILQAKIIALLCVLVAAAGVFMLTLHKAQEQTSRPITVHQQRAIDSMGTIRDRKDYLPK
jgi:hypothetical protein